MNSEMIFGLKEGEVPHESGFLSNAPYEFIIHKANGKQWTIGLKWKWNKDLQWYGAWHKLKNGNDKDEVMEFKCLLLHCYSIWCEQMTKYSESKLFGRLFVKYSKLRPLLIKLHLV